MAGPKTGLSLSKLPTPAKVGVGVAIGFLLLVAYFIVFYSDASSDLKRAVAEEITLREKLKKSRDAQDAYTKDMAELAERQQRQRELNKVLPEATEYPAFLSSLQTVANVAGVSIESYSPMEEVIDQFYAKVPMKLKLSGKYHQVAKFFYGVGQLDRIINVENIGLSTPKKEGEDVFIKVECLATAFRSLPAKPAASAAPAGKPAPASSAKPGGK
jgi:type IV pilus assembly protein PilO